MTCALSVKYPLDMEDIAQKKDVKYLLMRNQTSDGERAIE